MIARRLALGACMALLACAREEPAPPVEEPLSLESAEEFRGHVVRTDDALRFEPCGLGERWSVEARGRAFRTLDDSLVALRATAGPLADGVRAFAVVWADTSMLGRFGRRGTFDRVMRLRVVDSLRVPAADDCPILDPLAEP